jgi:hypothetical protein
MIFVSKLKYLAKCSFSDNNIQFGLVLKMCDIRSPFENRFFISISAKNNRR